MARKEIHLGQVSRHAARVMAAGGANQKQIAKKLGIKPRTAAKYLKKEIEEGKEELRKRVEGEYKKLAFSNLKDFMTVMPDGSVYFDMSRATPAQWAAVAEINTDEYIEDIAESTDENGVKQTRKVRKMRIKLHDKKGTLDSLSRTLGMFVDKTELTAEGGAPFTVVVSSVLDRKE